MMYPKPVLTVYCFFTNKPDAPPVYIEKQRSLKQFICSSYPQNSRCKHTLHQKLHFKTTDYFAGRSIISNYIPLKFYMRKGVF